MWELEFSVIGGNDRRARLTCTLPAKRNTAGRGVAAVGGPALNHAQRNSSISNGSPLRTDRVLGMRNWNNAGATDETDGRFDRGDAIGIARTDNAAVRFATKRYGGKIRGSGGGRSSARAARIAIDSVGIVCLSTAPGPTTDRLERTEVCPFGQIRFAEDDRATRAQIRRNRRILFGRLTDQRKRTGAGLHFVAGIDVVLQENRNSVKRAENFALLAHLVGIVGLGKGVRVQLDDGVNARSVLIKRIYPVDVKLS